MASQANKSIDWQTTVQGVGIVEFVELSNQDPFLKGINQYLDADDKLHQLSARETHARVPFVHSGLQHKLTLPNGYGELFNDVFLTTVIDTNQLARVLLYGAIGEETFQAQRETNYDGMREPLRLEHAGLEVLREAESELSAFLREEVGAGVFTEHADDWADYNEHEYGHPGFRFYDFSETPISSLSEFRTQRHEETLFLGMGKTDSVEHNLTSYADGQCLANASGRRYFTTPLGSFPFRYLFVRLQAVDEPESPFRWDLPNPDDGIPEDFKAGYAPLARSYVQLFWSLYSYFELATYAPELSEYVPEHVQADDRGVYETLDSMTDSEKAALLDDLYDGNRILEECWVTLQQQFESSKTIQSEYGGFATRKDSVARPLITAATDIELLCEDRVNRFNKRYDQLIDRVQSHLDANVGIVGKQLSIVLFALTLATTVIQLPAIFSGSHTALIVIMLGLIFAGALWLLFGASLQRRLSF